MFKAALAIAATLLISASASAQYPGQYYGNHGAPYYGQRSTGLNAPTRSTPEAIVHEGLSTLRAFVLAGGGGDQGRARKFAETQIAPYFDFPYMARWAAGKYWARANDAQKQKMTATLRSLFLTSLVRNLGGYNNPGITIHRARQAAEDEINVAVTVRYGQAASLRLVFRFYQSAVGWKVFDVTDNGASALVHYRKYFARQMQQVQRIGQRRTPYGYSGYGYRR